MWIYGVKLILNTSSIRESTRESLQLSNHIRIFQVFIQQRGRCLPAQILPSTLVCFPGTNVSAQVMLNSIQLGGHKGE